MEVDNGPGPFKIEEKQCTEKNNMEMQHKKDKHIKQIEGDQESDEATNPLPPGLVLKEKEQQISPRKVEELVKKWGNEWGERRSPKNEEEINNTSNMETNNRIIKCRNSNFQQKEKETGEGKHVRIDDGEGYYIVELPEEEEEADQSRMMIEWEQNLALEMSNKLQIKRKREEPTKMLLKEREEHEDEEEETSNKKAKKEAIQDAEGEAFLE
ncbi:hypothetical protein PIB30_021670 [Stylosanthes scabra]|uniref:Uncharacterized protein n=1 Tax=Stylosanthes scabra TaxID=79078 RepID=A0ABU6Z983_9FABA|nr:hypothetical protein [Stylosanthes scabra]